MKVGKISHGTKSWSDSSDLTNNSEVLKRSLLLKDPGPVSVHLYMLPITSVLTMPGKSAPIAHPSLPVSGEVKMKEKKKKKSENWLISDVKTQPNQKALIVMMNQ